jgi:hypothetical protein
LWFVEFSAAVSAGVAQPEADIHDSRQASVVGGAGHSEREGPEDIGVVRIFGFCAIMLSRNLDLC